MWIFNVSNLGFWEYRKQTYFILWKRFYEKVSWIFTGTRKKCNWFLKEEYINIYKEELKPHQDAKVCYICVKRSIKIFANDKISRNVWDHCHYKGKYRRATDNICNLKIVYLMKSLPFFTTVQITNIMLSSKN